MTCSGDSVLHAAARNGDKLLVEALVKAGADTKYANKKKAPIYTAAKGGHTSTVELLISKNADVNAKDR
jgi:ankyrin repeat protein